MDHNLDPGHSLCLLNFAVVASNGHHHGHGHDHDCNLFGYGCTMAQIPSTTRRYEGVVARILVAEVMNGYAVGVRRYYGCCLSRLQQGVVYLPTLEALEVVSQIWGRPLCSVLVQKVLYRWDRRSVRYLSASASASGAGYSHFG